MIEMALTVEDVESIKRGEPDNPTQIYRNDRAVKWYKCRKYDSCLILEDKKNAVNWSCVNCNFARNARIKDLVIFRARLTQSKVEIEAVINFEKSHHIKKISKTDNFHQ